MATNVGPHWLQEFFGASIAFQYVDIKNLLQTHKRQRQSRGFVMMLILRSSIVE